jgi:hypothetical protein
MSNRHRMSDSDMLKGLRKALKSPRTPSNLKPGLRRLEDRLAARIARRKNPPKRDFLSRLFGF